MPQELSGKAGHAGEVRWHRMTGFAMQNQNYRFAISPDKVKRQIPVDSGGSSGNGVRR